MLRGSSGAIVTAAHGAEAPLTTALATFRSDEEEALRLGNIDAWSALWSNDVVLLSPGRPALVGKSAARLALRAAPPFTGEATCVNVTAISEETIISGAVAWEYGVIRAIATMAGTVGESYFYFNVLGILRYQPDSSWRIHRLCWNRLERGFVPPTPQGHN
ncbi:MAG: YybH family protein [Chloroflexota bacterium]